MYKDLKNKNVIITGGVGFLGTQIVNAFIKSKSNIFVLDIKKKKNRKNLKYFNCDITDEKQIKEAFLKIKKVDILINNAANDYHPNKLNKKTIFENFDINTWEKDLKVGLTGAMLCTKIFGKQMARKKGGIILNISSDLGIIAPNQDLYAHKKTKKPVSYSVIKHGIIGLTKYTAAYWSHSGLRCNAIAPGGIFNNQDKLFLKKIKKQIPIKRMAKRNEYNDLVLFLCSSSSSYITGSTIVADGGRSII